MKTIIAILLSVFFLRSFSQQDLKDTIWFNNNWEQSAKQDAAFYRVYAKTEKGFLVYDKFLNGKNQMVSEASAILPELVQEGYSVYYNENGAKDKRGFYKNDNKVGTWISYFENEKDSSVYSYKENGEIEYIRKSKLQKEEIFTVVEVMPEYPGGIKVMMNFVSKNIRYPKVAKRNNIQGKAFVRFVIGQDGSVTDSEVIKSTGNSLLDDEALRVVNLMPTWSPGTQNGKPVRVMMNLPISFVLK